MLNFLYLTGDLHGQLGQLENFKPTRPFETGIVLLGDSGANYYLNKRELSDTALEMACLIHQVA